MPTPEQAAWQSIQREMGALWHVQRHEDKYSPDIPDASFCYLKVSGWIELKAAKHNEALKLRPGQLNWLVRRGECCPCFLIWRTLDDKGKHLHWSGMGHREIPLLRHLRRPTPDMITVSLEPLTGTKFRPLIVDLLSAYRETARET